jgi:formimidoylglutamate deiminase
MRNNTIAVGAMPNAHSHAFQRDLRGAAERPAPAAHAQDDFWTWRTEMFRLADALDPDAMYDVARRTYAQMLAAGYGVVGEFHYVHHQPDGTPYDEPNAMAIAVAEAARSVGLPIVLIPAAYHRNGWDGRDRPPEAGQRRFCDPDVDTFLARVEDLRAWAGRREGVLLAVAAHSVRAVPAAWLSPIAAYAEEHGLPRHVHAHEQRRELAETEAEHGRTPIALLAETDTIVVACPTTEGNLGDGHLPALRYRDAGVRLAIGSDSQVRIDPFEEVREMETGARRAAELRYGLLARYGDLWGRLADNGRASLGVAGVAEGHGTIDVDLDHPDLAGIAEEDLPLALATCASAGVVARTVADTADGTIVAH